MAKAFKCDRCGDLYEEKQISNSGLCVGKMDYPCSFKPYDLCYACRAYLEVWWSAAYKGDAGYLKDCKEKGE